MIMFWSMVLALELYVFYQLDEYKEVPFTRFVDDVIFYSRKAIHKAADKLRELRK